MREREILIPHRRVISPTFIGSSGCHATSTHGDLNCNTLSSLPASRSHTEQQQSSVTFTNLGHKYRVWERG